MCIRARAHSLMHRTPMHPQDFIDQRLKPTVKSEEPPKKNDGPVRITVGKTFPQDVYEFDGDVLMFFYAPWCGHCTNFKPTYERLAKKLAKVKKLRLAKMDLTKNDIPYEDKEAIKVEGFPTWVINGKKLEGEQTLEELAKLSGFEGQNDAALMVAELF